jgi:hypothetical protein
MRKTLVMGLTVFALAVSFTGCGTTLESMRASDRVLGTRTVDKDAQCVCTSIFNTAKTKYSRRMGIPIIWDSTWDVVAKKGEVFGQQTALWGQIIYFSIYLKENKTVIVWKPMPGVVADITHYADSIVDDSNLQACPDIK